MPFSEIRSSLLLLVLISFLQPSCSDDSDEESLNSGKMKGSCTLMAQSAGVSVKSCVEYENISKEQAQTAKNSCEKSAVSSSIWKSGSTCPSAGKIGKCTIVDSGLKSVTFEYKPTTPKDGEINCTSVPPMGEWEEVET